MSSVISERGVQPRTLLACAAGCVVASALLALPRVFSLHVAGYLLGSFLTILLVALYRRTDLERRARPDYFAHPSLAVAATALAGLGTIVAGLHVWWIATELAG